MLPNIPAMNEAHFAVPMAGAVLNALNIRLDAPSIAFQLDHAGTRVLFVDREFAGVVAQALAQAKVKPLVIDYDDPEYAADAPYPKGERIGSIDYEDFVADGDEDFALSMPDDDGMPFRSLTPPVTGNLKGCRLSSPRCGADGLYQHHPCRHGQARRLSTLPMPHQRLVLSLAAAGRHPCCCAGCGRGRSTTPSPITASPTVWRAVVVGTNQREG
jgi:fatty-acyl-CoA synthase